MGQWVLMVLLWRCRQKEFDKWLYITHNSHDCSVFIPLSVLGAVDTYTVSSLYSQGLFMCLCVDCGWNTLLLAVILGMGDLCLGIWMESWLTQDHFDLCLWFDNDGKSNDNDGDDGKHTQILPISSSGWDVSDAFIPNWSQGPSLVDSKLDMSLV